MRESRGLGKDARFYHIDEYVPSRYRYPSHKTHGFMDKAPSHEESKKMVADILLGKGEPLSGFEVKEDGDVDIQLAP